MDLTVKVKVLVTTLPSTMGFSITSVSSPGSGSSSADCVNDALTFGITYQT